MSSGFQKRVLDKIAKESDNCNTWKELRKKRCAFTSRICQGLVERAVLLAEEEISKEIDSVRSLELIKWESGSVKDYNSGRIFVLEELKKRLGFSK